MRISAFFLSLFLLVGCASERGHFQNRDSIVHGDYLFVPYTGEVTIPFETLVAGGSHTIFKTKDELSTVTSALTENHEPRIQIVEQTSEYAIVEVETNAFISRAILYEVEWPSPTRNFRYYFIHGFYKPINTGKGSPIFIYWPFHLFPLALNDKYLPLLSGESYQTTAELEDFIAFYDQICSMYGLVYTKTENTMELPSSFFYSSGANEDVIIRLTVAAGNVLVEIIS